MVVIEEAYDSLKQETKYLLGGVGGGKQSLCCFWRCRQKLSNAMIALEYFFWPEQVVVSEQIESICSTILVVVITFAFLYTSGGYHR